MFCVHPLARSPQARLRITGRICPMRGNNPSPEHTCRVGDRRGMTTERPGSPVTFCDGHHTDIANRALAQHQPLSNVGVAHSWIAGHMRRVARSAYRHRARPWTGAHEEAPSLTTIPHPAPPLDDYRVVAARQPAGASPGVRHPATWFDHLSTRARLAALYRPRRWEMHSRWALAAAAWNLLAGVPIT